MYTLVCVADDASSSIQYRYSSKLVGDGLEHPSDNTVEVVVHTRLCHKGKVKVKVGFFYRATYAVMPRPAALYNHRKWQLIGKS